jgi:hypothetical protein
MQGGGELFGVLRGICIMANAILGVYAVCWVGMWKGLAAKRPSGVVMWAVALVEGIPLGIMALVAVIMHGSSGFWWTVVPFLQLAKNLFFISWGQQQLCNALRAPKVSWTGRRPRPGDGRFLEARERESMAG